MFTLVGIFLGINLTIIKNVPASKNLEPQTSNLKPQTSNLKPRTSNFELS